MNDRKRGQSSGWILAVGALAGLTEAVFLQDPIDTWTINADRSVYFHGWLAYGLVSLIPFLLLRMFRIRIPLRPAWRRFGFLFALLGGTASFLYAVIPPYRLSPAQAAGSSPNVILITLDTTRADHLGCYGYPGNTSPFLDSLAREGILFERAYTTATWTLPAHASLFTGLMPTVHGVGYENFFAGSSLKTLAEVLKERGYATAAFISGPFLDSAFNLDQGFDYYDEPLHPNGTLKRMILFRSVSKMLNLRLWETDGQRRADEVHQTLFPYLRWLKNRQSFFLFINYFDPHEPYDPPEETRDERKIRVNMKGTIRHYPLNKQTGIACHPDGTPLSAEEFRELQILYDGEIGYLDSRLEILWNTLKELGLLNNTLVFITSDHGETIGEHQFLDHGHNLYQEQLHIPLLIWSSTNRNGGLRIPRPVQIIDLFPTVLDALSFPLPGPIQGRSLLPLIKGDPLTSRPVLAELDEDSHPRFAAFRRSQQMILEDKEKYIHSSNGKKELYDLESDPGEIKNLVTEEPESALDKKAEMDRYFEAWEALHQAGSGEMDEETREKLRALGYIE